LSSLEKMRVIALIAATTSFLTTLVSAQNALAISAPANGDQIQAGTTTTITWAPDTAASVALVLRYGEASNLAPGAPIGTYPNTGSVQWMVPAGLVSGTQYTIEIADADGGTNVNFSPFFAITGGTGVSALPSAAASSGASSAAASSAAVSSPTSGASGTTDASSATTKPVTLSGDSSTKTTKATATGTGATATATASASSNDALMRSGSLAAVIGMGALVMLA